MYRVLCFAAMTILGLPGMTYGGLIMIEDFEDNTVNFTVTGPPGSGLFHDGGDDYFTMVPLNGSVSPSDGAYTGFGGSNFFAAEDIDDGGTRPGTQTLSFNVNIAGFQDLTFSGLFGAGGNDANDPTYDDEESVLVRAKIDGGSFQNLLAFEALEPGGDTTNNQVRQDANFDTVGDPTGFLPTSALTAFNNLAISGTGNNLLLEIIVTSTDGGSEFAFDNISVSGNATAVIPEPSTFTMFGLLGIVAGLRRRSR